jgi:RNA polymerase sigma factor for flagellar operon FliA
MTPPEREAEILRLFPLVDTIARVVWRQIRRVDLDDLVGDGSLGLIAAVDSYNPARGMSLERYARLKILYAMLDGARRTDHLPQFTRRVLQSAERDRYALALELGRMPSPGELERRHPKLRSAQCSEHLRRPISLDASEAIDALLKSDWQSDPASVLCARETHGSVRRALRRLPPRHRELLRLYYARGYRLADVARQFSLTKQRVAQLRDRALATVRQAVVAS